jgi:(2Fe-2S) ferredoxin
MKSQPEPYQRQIFVCTNHKADGTPCCGDRDGELIFRKLREIAKERGLHPRLRVAQAKCLGQCARGVNVMIYPEETWCQDVTLNDVPGLADIYLR